MAIQNVGGNEPYTPAATTTGSLLQPAAAPVIQAPQAPQTSQPTLSPMQPSSSGAITMQDGSQIDPSIVALMHGLKTAEGTNGNYTATGDNGTAAGIAQWSNQVDGKVQPLAAGQIPVNFQNAAQQYGLDPTDFSPENQNKVLYAEIKAGKDAGLTPEQILSKHNSGDPNKYADAATSTGTGQVGPYDVAGYVQRGMTAAQQYAQQNNQAPQTANGQNMAQQSQITASPSVGGFLGNIVKSGANLLGGIGEAVVHPLTTAQNLASIPVGGLEELAGNTNDETQKFDAFTNYFKQRYGGISNIENTLYSDPVGVLADLSTALGIGGGALGLGAKAAELGGLGTAADVAGSIGKAGEFGGGFVSDIGSSRANGVAGALKTGADALNTGAEYTNPLSLPIKGGIKAVSLGSNVLKEGLGQVLGQSSDVVQFVMDHPDLVTDETLKNTSRTAIAQDIETALNKKESELGEAGAAYEPIKQPGEVPGGYENVKNAPAENAIPVSKNFLEEQIRSVGKLDVEDGEIKPTTTSKVGKGELSKLQDVLDTFKPAFQRGYLSPEEFLTLRKRLDAAAFNESGIKNTNLADIAAGVRTSLNDTYRSSIPGLEEADNNFSQQISELKKLRKGILDKDGNLLDSATNKIANASGKGKDKFLERLEQITPGITLRLQALKTIEELNNSGIKVGAYTRSILQAGRTGAALFGAATGNVKMLAGALAMDLISQPKTAVAIMKAVAKVRPEVVAPVLATVAKFAVRGVVANNSTSFSSSTTPTNTQVGNLQNTQPQSATAQISGQTQTPTQGYNPLSSNLTQLASNKGFDLEAARNAGYSDSDIQQYLTSNTP